jgi:hypothetical protein
MKEFTIKIVNARQVSWAVLSADVAFGFTDDAGAFHGVFTVPDVVLKKSPTKGYYFNGPSKLFMKNGEVQKDEEGRDRYLEFLKLYAEKGANPDKPSEFAVTSDAWEGRKHVIGLLVEAARTLGIDVDAPQRGRPAAKAPAAKAPAARAAVPARPTRPATAQTVVEEDDMGSAIGDDDELPF